MRFKGSNRIYGIFTVDINLDVIELEKEKKRELTNMEKKIERVRKRIKRDDFHGKVFSGQQNVADKFESDSEIVKMRKDYNPVSYLTCRTFIKRSRKASKST